MNMTELNKVLGEGLLSLHNGKGKADKLNAMARAGSVMVAAANTQLKAFQLIQKSGKKLPRLPPFMG